LHNNQIGGPVNIRRREAKQATACANQAVLAAIVIDQSIAMVAAVELDCQALNAIEQVRTT